MHLKPPIHRQCKSPGGIILLLLGLLTLFSRPVSGQVPSGTLELFRADLQSWYSSYTGRAPETELLVFSPVMIVDPALSSTDPFVAQQSILLLTDSVPIPNRLFTGSGRRTYDIYKTILDNRALENRQLSADEGRRLKRARNILLKRYCPLIRLFELIMGKPSRVEYSHQYARYLEFAKRYAVLQTQLTRENDSARRAELELAIQNTMKEWIKKGHKKKIDGALKDLREITSKDPELFWAKALTEFRRNVRVVNGISMPMTQLNPKARDWAQSKEWIPWQNGNSSGFLMLVSITRQWLRPEILTTRKWAWAAGPYKRDAVLISDGAGLMTHNAGRELMPLLPVQLLIAKDVVSDRQPLSAGEPVIVGVVCKVLPKLPAK